ncbi:MAG TPA: hypothetical protein VGF94_23085, partial [Kofleriaceae bacterium]
MLLGNLEHLYTGRWLTWIGLAQASPRSALESAAHWFMELAVQSRARTLLTFLFGLGFAMQLLRADARGQAGARAVRPVARRVVRDRRAARDAVVVGRRH